MSVLRAHGLRKRYEKLDVVNDVDLDIAPGECFGLLGPNGAGKTTTLRLCLGLTYPDAGQIELLGEPVPARAREARQRVGVVPQFDNLDPDFTVAENLLVFGRYFGIARDAVAGRLAGLLEFAGLTGREDARLNTLSGGMKRRLTLARALINDPQLLFMDEPTTGLDPQARHLIWERLRRLTQEGKTLILTTHFMEEAERLCHRLAIMDRGRLIAVGSPRALIAEHIEPHVIEVHGNGFEQWLERARRLAARLERAGDTVFVYAADPAPVLADLSARPQLSYVHRPASLEDVFLKLTGRDLRD
ncbi:MAG TPA: ATP-binding cassette domain-containing protein [Burkholderiales bacterium]|nr:ATP-binding cassette domain-containing protein [Burkholderiales bacterium]